MALKTLIKRTKKQKLIELPYKLKPNQKILELMADSQGITVKQLTGQAKPKTGVNAAEWFYMLQSLQRHEINEEYRNHSMDELAEKFPGKKWIVMHRGNVIYATNNRNEILNMLPEPFSCLLDDLTITPLYIEPYAS